MKTRAQNHYLLHPPQHQKQSKIVSVSPNTKQSPLGDNLGNAIAFMKSTQGIVLGSCLVGFVLLQMLSGESKGKIATSYWGGGKEKKKAAVKAKKQISNPTRNNVALYIGMPDFQREKLEQSWYEQGLLKSKPNKKGVVGKAFEAVGGSGKKTMFFADSQRGTSVSGGAGAGKTFTVIDPLIRSALDQGFPVVLYDFKFPAQTKRTAAYAMKRGYNVKVFAPGFPESETCNIFDLIRDEEDAVAAGQLAEVINRNTNLGGSDSGDKFFQDAAAALIQGIFLVTKLIEKKTGTKDYCDLMMASEIMNLSKFPQRMGAARNRGDLNIWAAEPLKQIISLADSEKTVASVIGTAQRVFQLFLKRDFIGAFCGKTTIPLDLDGKQLLIFGLDRNNRDIVGPLLAAILHMVVTRNISRVVPRKDPLVVALDELPTLYLPQIANWFAEGREDGFCGIIGYQTFPQLEKAYGREMAQTIFANTATKVIFNPQDHTSAEVYSKYLGEQEIRFKSKSRSTGKGGGSTSTNDQQQKRPLLEPSEFLKLPTGRAVIINPAYTRQKEAYVPLIESVKVPNSDIAEMSWSEQKWSEVFERIGANNRKNLVSDAARSIQLEQRHQFAEKLFPEEASKKIPTPEELADVF